MFVWVCDQGRQCGLDLGQTLLEKIAFVNFLDQRQIIGESNEKNMHNQLNYDLHFLKKKKDS